LNWRWEEICSLSAINGTLVGGLVGLAIYTVSRLLR